MGSTAELSDVGVILRRRWKGRMGGFGSATEDEMSGHGVSKASPIEIDREGYPLVMSK